MQSITTFIVIHPGTVLIVMTNYERWNKLMSSGSRACSPIWYKQEITYTIFGHWTSHSINLLVSSKRKTKSINDHLLNWWCVMSHRPESATFVIEDELNRGKFLIGVQAKWSVWDSGILIVGTKISGILAQCLRPGITSTIIFLHKVHHLLELTWQCEIHSTKPTKRISLAFQYHCQRPCK